MKNFQLLLAAAIAISSVAGASIAVLHNFPAKTQASTSLLDSLSSTATSAENPPAVFTNISDQTVSVTKPREMKLKTAALVSTKLDDFPHQRFTLVDKVKPGSDFARFRQRLRYATKLKDMNFIRTILPSDKIAIGYGETAIGDLKLENRESAFWLTLEKAIAVGCTAEVNLSYPELDPESQLWSCNNITKQLNSQSNSSALDPSGLSSISRVVVIGKNVSVRSQPQKNSAVVALLSNEVVEVDHQIKAQQVAQTTFGESNNPINNWTPVILPQGRKGYVYNRFVYSPSEYQAVFGKIQGTWRLLAMPGG
ncbi:MAG TPA: SH3 domain-containing protein [Oculatellaceae cyanobacterium]|jgi:hypothetical protein